MKKRLVFVTLFLSISYFTFAQIEELYEIRPLGLISYLHSIKEISENKVLWSDADHNERKSARLLLAETATEETKLKLEKAQKAEDENKLEIHKQYAKLKWLTDVFIYQFAADMTDRKGLVLYRGMNKNLSLLIDVDTTKRISNRLKKYSKLLRMINESFLKLITSKIRTGGMQNVGDLQELFTFAGINPYSIYKDIKESKQKKLDKLVGYVRERRLEKLHNLLSLTKPVTDDKKNE